MRRWFNIAGPCKVDIHYMLPPMARLPELRQLVERQTYFVLHAPRQTGKSTALYGLAAELTKEGRYVAVVLDVKPGSAFSQDAGAAERAILGSWRNQVEWQLPAELQPPPWPDAESGSGISTALRAWASACPRPLVTLLDEVDSLRDQALISLLDQLRTGYPGRPQGFPWSLALVGLRDVRDYRVGDDRLRSGSPFNIVTKSLTLRDFNRDEVAALYQQHTDDTGQRFAPDAIDRVMYLTGGQPWLVNALAAIAVDDLVTDRSRGVTVADIDVAKERLLASRNPHFDSLAERLREPRVRRLVEPILAGRTIGEIDEDDRQLVVDLGLLRRSTAGGLEVANPLYREIIPRVLVVAPQDSLPQIAPTWLRGDGRIDAQRLLSAFLDFWRQHGEPLLATTPYHEIAPHLVLMAFLHRVVNGGGTLEREYAIGRGRMDLCLRYGPDTMGIELKVWRDGERDPLVEGLAQLDGYLAGLNLDTGWLVIFDRRGGQPPIAERTRAETAATPAGRTVTVIRA